VICAYYVNDRPFYLFMASNSLKMLRENSDIHVRVFLFEQDWPDEAENGLYLSKNQFLANCDSLNVEVVRKETDVRRDEFFLINKSCIAECEEDSVLFLDVDTFVFGDVAELFSLYGDVDFAACENRWVEWNQNEFFTAFNGGVQFFNNGLHREILGNLPQTCQQLAVGDSKLSLFLREENCLWNVEEFAISKMIEERGVKWRFFSDQEAKNAYSLTDVDVPSAHMVFHPYTVNWKRVYNSLKKKNKFAPRFLGKSH
jgi:hypothetical protein